MNICVMNDVSGWVLLFVMVIVDGIIEVLKWFVLFVMIGDYVNKYLFNGMLLYLFEVGCLVLFFFVFVLVYNFVCLGVFECGLYG